MKLTVYGMRFASYWFWSMRVHPLRRNVQFSVIVSLFFLAAVAFYGFNEYNQMERVFQNNVSYSLERRQLSAFALLSNYPKILDITDKLFLLLESVRDTGQYEIIRLAFETLVVDLWNFYQNNTDSSRRGVSGYSWETDRERKHLITCSNIQTLTYRSSMGGGFVKSVYLADFQGTPVVVKVKHLNIINDSCEDKFKCAVERDIRILNEIILLGGLRHPMFNTLLGFCIHSGFESVGLLAIPGVVAVYEAGKRIDWDNLALLTFKDALRQAMAFAEFLDYAENSPFGRLTLIDLHTEQFVKIGTYFTLTDMDLATNVQDPMCNDVETELKPYRGYPTKMCVFHHPHMIGYSFEVPCVRGKCLHVAQKHNMGRINDLVFMHIFDFTRIPKRLHKDINRILTEIRWYLPAAKLYTELEAVLAKYTDK